ncbi:Rmt family 16S rRNA (guanine(1405)-N(7))-methyltransferase [Frankia casuarinae]|uniref:Rmt family 16S rRNA (guanine(1405)-N(7))-methyltransferase n=1 Tax=Frankia casuarinae (strain DSM 45818 / CECT 9043 / HFP020203 / CcI3) TaxID=106370 RepID=UPI001F2D6D9D|nr:Rmt family 16S rRNA (guanine(1405)-N(7))-methyltransferase [Frankia casuarinae]
MGSQEQAVDRVRETVARSRRYGAVAPETVRRLAERALVASRGDEPEAVKRTKRSLHEIYGAYLPERAPGYPGLLRDIGAAVGGGDPDAVAAAVSRAMRVHASTRERLPYLREFYAAVFGAVPTPAVVQDLACGLNPLAFGSMGLPAQTTYLASDIDSQQMEFLDRALDLLEVEHRVEVVDLVSGAVPAQHADVTLVLKTLPLLERQRAGAGWELVDALRSPFVVVSFPTRSLGQRSKGMFQTYSAAFEAQAAERGWTFDQAEIANELIYIVRR